MIRRAVLVLSPWRKPMTPFWQPRERYGRIYEVDIRDNGLKLSGHNNYADCIGHFCAKSNQRIVK